MLTTDCSGHTLFNLMSPNLALAIDSSGRLRWLTAPSLGWACLDTEATRVPPVLFLWTSASGELPLDPPTLHPWKSVDRELHLRGSAAGVGLDLEICLGHAGAVFRIHVSNQGFGAVTRLRFQITGPLQCCAGALMTYPVNSGWCVPVAAFGPDELIAEHYPVHASMQWLDLYLRDRGIYLAVEDPVPYYKTFLVGRQQGDPYLAWEFSDLNLHPGEEFSFPPIRLALHAGDWRAGADLYRVWAEQHFANPDVPEWYRTLPAWNWTGFRGQHAPCIWNRTSDLPAISEQTARLGVELVQLTAYTEHGHDTGYPDYVVGPSLGGDVGMRRAVDLIHAAGRRLSIYTNGRIVDPASSLSVAQRQAWGVRTAADAAVQSETYGSVSFDIMCPGATDWALLFARKLTYLVQRYDVDGIYIDQVCGCTSLPCYARGHRHTRPNEAWASYRSFLQTLRSILRELKPELFLATEGVNDCLGQYFDSQQSHEDWVRRMEGRGTLLPELYRYTFPQHLLNVGCIRANEPLYVRVAHTLGSGFDLGISEFNDLTPEFTRSLRWALGVRRRYSTLYSQGTSDPQLAVSREGWRANAFVSPNEVLVAAAWLLQDEPPDTVEMAAPWPFATPAVLVQAESPAGCEECRVEYCRGEVTVRLPGREMFLVKLAPQP